MLIRATMRNLAIAIALMVTTIGFANAELRVDITQGKAEPLPIAVADFFGRGSSDSQIGREMAGVIAADLQRSGLFKPIDKRAFIQTDASLSTLPRFGDWRIINAQALVQGRIQLVADGRLRVEFRLWDVFAEQQMVGLAYFTVPDNWRRVAHIIADAIYKRITGEDGYFDTRIVYIAESGPELRRVKRLAIMDQDGENHRFLTDGSELVLTPRFSPTLQEITYLSYRGNTPRVYIFNIDTGRQELLGDFPGMTFAPRCSPDGQLRNTRLVTTWRSDCIHKNFTWDILHWCDAARWHRRTVTGAGLSGRIADVVPERARVNVLPTVETRRECKRSTSLFY